MEIQDLKSANCCWSTQQLCSVMVINGANHSIQERFFSSGRYSRQWNAMERDDWG